MLYQIIYPFTADIYGDTFKEAVKNYVKFNYNNNITNMIIKDQSNSYEAKLNYYMKNNKNKVGISISPYDSLLNPMIPIPIAPVIKTNTPITFAPNIYSNPIAPNIYSNPIAPNIYSNPIAPNIYSNPIISYK